MDTRTDTAYRIAFAGFRNINLGVARHFASLGIGAEEFFTYPARRLAMLTGLREAYFDDDRRHEALEKAAAEARFVADNGIGMHYFTDDSYPRRMAECDDAPAMLFSFGKVEETAHTIAIVGTRHCTAYGAEFTRRLVADLGKALDSVAIISGLAYGIDICAHRAALDAGIPTGAVLAHGLNTVYPADHRDDARRIARHGGFILTEYPSHAAIHRGNFLSRNRIVAALADVTVVVESDIKGGAMTTARIAAAYNRDVMALPGRVTDAYSRGCNELIARREAAIVRDAADIIEAMNWSARPAEGEQPSLPFLTDEQTRIVDFLKAHEGASANDMCAALGIPFPRLSAALFEMEMEDLLGALPGGRYCIINPDI